jgi:Recombinase
VGSNPTAGITMDPPKTTNLEALGFIGSRLSAPNQEARAGTGQRTFRGRMLAGARNKARRGELYNHAPIGHARVPGGGLMLDPDEQARDVVRLIFDKFDELGTVSGLLRYLVRHGIRPGFRPHFGPHKGELEWRRPDRATLNFLLHHPIYAGAYSRGRRPTRGGKSPGGPRPAAWSSRWINGRSCSPITCPATSRGSATRRTSGGWRGTAPAPAP